MFPSDEPHVSIPISYFEELKRKANGEQYRTQTPARQQHIADRAESSAYGGDKLEGRPSKRPRTSSSWPTPSAGSYGQAGNSSTSELDPRLMPATAGLDALGINRTSGHEGTWLTGLIADASAHAAHGHGDSTWTTNSGPSPHNPLVGSSLSFIYDSVGRMRKSYATLSGGL